LQSPNSCTMMAVRGYRHALVRVFCHARRAHCTMIRAEIQANNTRAQDLADEQGGKVAQNVAAGVVGLVIWPVWFGMDFKGAASKDAAALQARQEYLTTLATQRCTPGYRPPPGAYQAPYAPAVAR
jgi:hypothetical protein